MSRFGILKICLAMSWNLEQHYNSLQVLTSFNFQAGENLASAAQRNKTRKLVPHSSRQQQQG